MNCKYCGCLIEDGVTTCPECGKALYEEENVEETIELKSMDEWNQSEENLASDESLEDDYTEVEDVPSEEEEMSGKKPFKGGILIATLASVLVIACIVVVLLLANKDKKEPSVKFTMSDGTVVGDYEAYTQYITDLGNYKDVKINMTPEEVTEEEIDDTVNSALLKSATTKDITDRDVAEDGDVVNIDFTGYLDGQPFENGSGTNHELQIGAGGYIEGFAEGIIGHKVGETFEVNTTFPENYNSAELAGKDTVFVMTLNSIKESVTPELNDQWVAENTDYATVEEYRQSIRDDLEQKALSTLESSKAQRILSQIYDNTTFSTYPDDMVQDTLSYLKQYYEAQASYVGMSLTDMLAVMQMSQEQFDEQMEELAKKTVGTRLIIFDIAKLEGMKLSEDDYKTLGAESATSMGFENLEAYEAASSKSDIYDSLIVQKVSDFISDNAVEVDEPIATTEK